LQIDDTRRFGREQPHAAAVDARRQLHVEALFQRLDPAQRHADARIRLARRDGF